MDRIERRSALLAAIRQYFRQQDVAEVFTATIRPFGVTDPHLQNIPVTGHGYLQTSPEYAMKMLLAEARRSIYQICPAYRGGESGSKHRTEFQMLEWYRCDYDLVDLMDDVDQFLAAVGLPGIPQRVTYKSLFLSRYPVNPHRAETAELLSLARSEGAGHLDESAARADCLDMLFSPIERSLTAPTIVTEYPACQAALARVEADQEGDAVSQRFEVYAAGIELANAYLELNDAAELRRRFEYNMAERRRLGLPGMQIDETFMNIVDRVPDCAGIALGIDRLLMVLAGVDDIALV